MADSFSKLTSDGIAAPLGQVIEAVGRGVADAQTALDAGSLAQTLDFYNSADADSLRTIMREIGYRPTFYAIPETHCEMQVSIRIGGTETFKGRQLGQISTRTKLYVTPIDAGFANRYSYSAEASARLSFKIVPVPPPTALEEIRPVPELIDQFADQAIETLEAIYFDVRLVSNDGAEISRDDLAGRKVIKQDPTSMTLTQIGSSVTLTLSSID